MTDESAYTVETIYDTGKTVCRGDQIKSSAGGLISFGQVAGRAGPDGFRYPAWSEYNYSDLSKYNHGALLLNVKQSIVGGGASSDVASDLDGEIRLVVNDSDYDNNRGEFTVTLNLSGHRLYKLPFK